MMVRENCKSGQGGIQSIVDSLGFELLVWTGVT